MHKYVITNILMNSVTIFMMYLTSIDNIFTFFAIYLLTMCGTTFGIYLLEKSLHLINIHLDNIFNEKRVSEIDLYMTDSIYELAKLSMYVWLQWIYMFAKLCIVCIGVFFLIIRATTQIIICCILYPFIITYEYFLKL